jgi:hypothetical protein
MKYYRVTSTECKKFDCLAEAALNIGWEDSVVALTYSEYSAKEIRKDYICKNLTSNDLVLEKCSCGCRQERYVL